MSGDETSKEARQESVERQLSGDAPAGGGEAASSSDEQLADDTTGRAPGVRGGHEVAQEEDDPGRHDVGTKGPTERPAGTSDPRDMTGVDPGGTRPAP
jgi:hypothetical protein